MIREILPDRLFIGNALDARDLRLLYRERIAAVVDLAAKEPPAQLGRDMIHFRTPLLDGATATMKRSLKLPSDASSC